MDRSRNLLFGRRPGVVALEGARRMATGSRGELHRNGSGHRWRRRSSEVGSGSAVHLWCNRFTSDQCLCDSIGLLFLFVFIFAAPTNTNRIRNTNRITCAQDARRAPLPLTLRTPGGSSPANGRVTQRRPMFRADALAFPFLMNQPIPRRI